MDKDQMAAAIKDMQRVAKMEPIPFGVAGVFDPEKVERPSESDICDLIYPNERKHYVLASDFDQLLELYRKALIDEESAHWDHVEAMERASLDE